MIKYNRLRDLRNDLDLTQSVIANYLSVSQRTYSRYENAERMIPPEILDKLADYYKTSVDFLMERTDTKKPYPKSKK